MSTLKRFEVRFLAEAIDDLDALYIYIAGKSSYEIADGYLARIERLCFFTGIISEAGNDGSRTYSWTPHDGI